MHAGRLGGKRGSSVPPPPSSAVPPRAFVRTAVGETWLEITLNPGSPNPGIKHAAHLGRVSTGEWGAAPPCTPVSRAAPPPIARARARADRALAPARATSRAARECLELASRAGRALRPHRDAWADMTERRTSSVSCGERGVPAAACAASGGHAPALAGGDRRRRSARTQTGSRPASSDGPSLGMCHHPESAAQAGALAEMPGGERGGGAAIGSAPAAAPQSVRGRARSAGAQAWALGGPGATRGAGAKVGAERGAADSAHPATNGRGACAYRCRETKSRCRARWMSAGRHCSLFTVDRARAGERLVGVIR